MAAAPLILAVDTAGPYISLALCQGDRLLGEDTRVSAASYLKTLLPSIDRLLRDCNKEPAEVEVLGVSRGPGYLTGLRIGLATVKGLALALECPVAAVSEFDIVAAGLPRASLPVCVVLDAKKKEVFAAFYHGAGENQENERDYLLLPPAVLARRITSPTLVTGWGLLVYGPLLQEMGGAQVVLAPPEFWTGRAEVLAQLSRRRWEAGSLTPLDHLSPLYLRPAAAEFAAAGTPARQP